MDPNRNETTAHLIARHPERLNILVTDIVSGATGWRRDDREARNIVVLRYGWTALNAADESLREINRPIAIGVPILRERFDAEALNRLGQPGAFVNVPDVLGIRKAVGDMRAAWGPLHVQDNSGLVADLHQGMWMG